MFVSVSIALGAASLIWASVCVLLPVRRLEGIVAGSSGLIAAAAASLAFVLGHFFRGIDIDFVPSGDTAIWFVGAFGWGSLLAELIVRAVPAARRRVLGAVPRPAGLRLVK